MKKRLWILLVVGVIALTTVVTVVACDNANNVDVAKAQEIAVNYMGVSADSVINATVIEQKVGNDLYYSVSFTANGVKYECIVDADDGEIEKILINDQNVTVTDVPRVPVEGNEQYIGAARAQEIAIIDAGATLEAVIGYEQEFDFDHGKYLYEIEFIFNGKEYDYEIVATDGTIYKKNIDKVTVKVPTAPEGVEYVGIEQAKAIALESAGVQDVTFTQVEFEKDHGVHVYEITFIKDLVEYEYEINAVTGAIIKNNIDGNPAVNEDGYIGAERAKEIAIGHAGVTSPTGVTAKLDFENGKYVYEVEFVEGIYEYEYEIDAISGNIVKTEKDIND